MSRGGPPAEPGRVYRCPGPARWLPRGLAGSTLASALLVGLRLIDTAAEIGGARLGQGVILLGALAALWLLRSGAELRTTVSLESGHVTWARRGARSRLALRDVDSIRYAAPFVAGRTWLPATLVRDRSGCDWRLSALLRDGGELVDELVRGTGRDDLAAWSEALSLRTRMGRGALRVVVGYLVALGMLILGGLFYGR